MRKELNINDVLRFYALMTMRSDLSIKSCINIAFTDFCRTLHGIGSNPHKDKVRAKATTQIDSLLQDIRFRLLNQAEFDRQHQYVCNDIREIYRKAGIDFHFGQAQKWLNMSCKYIYYLYLSDLPELSQNSLAAVEQNYKLFHLPIDNVVLEHPIINRLYQKHIGKIPWSRIDDYAAYLAFQVDLQQEIKIPRIVFEGQIWK